MTQSSKENSLPILGQPSTRRTALKIAGAALGLAAFGKAVSPLWVIPQNVSIDEFLQQHYKELTDADKQKIFSRIESETNEQYGADVSVSDPPPIPGVKFGYAINLSKCNGNGKCMEACNQENNHPVLRCLLLAHKLLVVYPISSQSRLLFHTRTDHPSATFIQYCNITSWIVPNNCLLMLCCLPFCKATSPCIVLITKLL